MMRIASMPFLCLTLLLLGACSPSMTGHVYVDANGNKEVDAGEKGVQGLHYTVTQDGKRVDEGYTDASGAYAIKAKGAGQYCVNLDKMSLQGQDPKFKPRLSTSVLIEEVAPPPAPKPGSSAKSVSMAKAVSSPADSYGAPISTVSSGAAEGTVSLSALSGCVQMGFSSQYVPVPIVLDYSETIGSVPTPSAKSIGPGENFDYKIIWPTSCRLVSSAIPDIFITTPESDVGIVSDASPMLDFSEPVEADSTAQSKDLTQDGLSSKVLHLRVRSNVSGDKTKYFLQQKIICPDGNSYSLPIQELTIVSKPMVSVLQDLQGSYGLGESPTNVVTVENNTQQTIVDAKLTVSFSNMVFNASSDNSSCKNLGDDIACTFDLVPNEKKEVKVKFTLPKTVAVTTTSSKEEYSIGASLKIASQTDVITADKIHFYLAPTPTP